MTDEQFKQLMAALTRIENLLEHGQVLQHNWTPEKTQAESQRQEAELRTKMMLRR